MDLEEWELLPKNVHKGLDVDLDEEAMKMSGKSLDMEYFICPTQDPVGETEIHERCSVVPTQLVQIPLTWEPVDGTDQSIKKNPDPDSLPSPRITFKTEFADIKLDSAARLTSPRYSDSEVEEGSDLRSKKEVDWEEGGQRLNLWKMGLNGIGAICSFGVAAAAATICVFFLGHNSNFHDNKRMKEVAKHATKLNEVISVMKGLPVARAQISFGGYYDGL